MYNFDEYTKNIRDLISSWSLDKAEKNIYYIEKEEKRILNNLVKSSWSVDTEQAIKTYNDKINILKKLKEDLYEAKKEKWETGFFWWIFSKKVVAQNIKEFDAALKAINVYILLSEWDKAKQALKEIEHKEQSSLNILLEKLRKDNSPESQMMKNELIKENVEKTKKLNKLKEKLIEKEKKYLENDEKERFKIKFKIIKDEIEILIWNKKNTQALNLLQNFIEENKDKSIVIDFFNREKKIILRNIEKQRIKENEKIKLNARIEALNLIWQTLKKDDEEKELEKLEEKEEKFSLIKFLKEKFSFYKTLKENIKKKKLLDEINMLIDENSKVKDDIAMKKLANMHKWLIKEISNDKMFGYELYWKILWADLISWDTFWFYDDNEKYLFFLWDATGHWIRAWLIVTLISKFFNKYAKWSDLRTLTYEINNWLKQDLKSRNFITWVFFEIIKKNIWEIKFVWMWHEPMLLFKSKERIAEKITPGWLAAGIRIIKDKNTIKVVNLEPNNDDILMIYSDWIVESKNINWDFYWVDRLKDSFLSIAKFTKDLTKIYEHLIEEVKWFNWWSKFNDDLSILLIKRNTLKDIQDDKSSYLKDLSVKEWLKRWDLKKLIWKTREEISVELEKIKKIKETKRIIKTLEQLYYTWEILKLKQEAIRFIKEWFIDKKINFYLRKAIENEQKYKIDQKNTKIVNKYNVLVELEKKWDYTTVITEIEDIIAKDWNI